VRSVLEKTWIGNHPGMVRFLAEAGRMIAEDKHVEGGPIGKPAKKGLSQIYEK
jgi:hypothetical protein